MRTATFAGALALAIVGVSLVSAEVMRKAVGQQIGAQTSAGATAIAADTMRTAGSLTNLAGNLRRKRSPSTRQRKLRAKTGR